MSKNEQITYFSPIVKEASESISPLDRAAFDLNFNISERIYQVLQAKGWTKRDLAKKTGKNESEVSRWFAFGHNFTCKTIALISQALGEDIIQVVH